MRPDHDELDDDADAVAPDAEGAAGDDPGDDESEDAPEGPRPFRRDAKGRPLVTVSGANVALGVPRSVTVAMEMTAMVGVNPVRGYAACLGACWQAGPSPRAPRAQLAQCGHSPAVYGQQVADELVRRGVTFAEILRAGQVAFALLAESMVTTQELEEQEGFSRPGRGR
jgi:hypothetical protein